MTSLTGHLHQSIMIMHKAFALTSSTGVDVMDTPCLPMCCLVAVAKDNHVRVVLCYEGCSLRIHCRAAHSQHVWR